MWNKKKDKKYIYLYIIKIWTTNWKNFNSAIFIHLQKSILINFQTNSHNIKNLQSINKNTFYTVSNPYSHNTPSILHTSLQILFSALFSRFPSIKLNLHRYHTFTFSSWMRRYWFYVKNDFRKFHQIFTFWDPLSQTKWFLRKCLSVCLSVCL